MPAETHVEQGPLDRNGVFEIHTGNQWQSLILPTLAKALGRPEASIVLKTYLLGGGFGRRLNGDYAVPAALAAPRQQMRGRSRQRRQRQRQLRRWR